MTLEELAEFIKHATPVERIKIRQMVEEVLDEPIKETVDHDTMLYVEDSKTAVRHSCGANVFREVTEEAKVKEGFEPSQKIYRCNGCGEWVGERRN